MAGQPPRPFESKRIFRIPIIIEESGLEPARRPSNKMCEPSSTLLSETNKTLGMEENTPAYRALSIPVQIVGTTKAYKPSSSLLSETNKTLGMEKNTPAYRALSIPIQIKGTTKAYKPSSSLLSETNKTLGMEENSLAHTAVRIPGKLAIPKIFQNAGAFRLSEAPRNPTEPLLVTGGFQVPIQAGIKNRSHVDMFLESVSGRKNSKFQTTANAATYYALSEVAQVLGIVTTPGTFNYSTITKMKKTLDQLKVGMDDIRTAPRKVAEEFFKEALSNIENGRNDLAIKKFEIVGLQATSALHMEDDFKCKVFSSRLLVFSQLMPIIFNHQENSFQPFEKLEQKDNSLCSDIIRQRLDQLSEEAGRKSIGKNKNLMYFLQDFYPILSVCSGMTNPTQNLALNTEEIIDFVIQPKYLPYEENDAATLPLGVYMEGIEVKKELTAFLWQSEEGNNVWIRVGGRVFKVPHTKSETMTVHISETKTGQFYKCYYSTDKDDGERVRCEHEQRLPIGIKTVDELTEALKSIRASNQKPIAEMKRLGSHYLKELGIDMDEENASGENLVDVVAKYGNIDMMRNLLDAGANIFANREEPTFVMIAGEGDPVKHKAVLLEFLERHKSSKKLNMTNKQGQTALHRAVRSKNKVFVKELIKDLDHFIEDNEGKKPKDYASANSEIHKLFEA